jgi:hypothetical protein
MSSLLVRVRGVVVVGGLIVAGRVVVVVVVRAGAEVVVRLGAGLCRVVCTGWVEVVAAGSNTTLSPPSSENAATAMNRLVVAAAGPKNQTHFLPMHKHLSKSARLRYP